MGREGVAAPVSRRCCGFYLQTHHKTCAAHLLPVSFRSSARLEGREGGREKKSGKPSTRSKARRRRHLIAVYSLNIDEYLHTGFTVCVATFCRGGNNTSFAAPCSRGYCVIIQCKCPAATHQFNVRSVFFFSSPLLTVQPGCRCCLARHLSPCDAPPSTSALPHSINARNISLSATARDHPHVKHLANGLCGLFISAQ